MKNENQPLVSIGRLIFNGENGMACAIDSLVEQGYSNLEIIISDNG
jgi:glycosyltransferase involved in cell wall biosynthesis